MKTVHIIGAGISGLSAAYFLHQQGYRPIVYEQSDRVGGLIGTHHCQYGIAEQAANAFIASQLLEQLCEALQIELVSTQKESKNRYFYRDKLTRWPLSLPETFITGFRFLRSLLTGNLKPRPGETTEQWGHRVIGKAASHYIMATGLQGVYAGDFSRLSASLILGAIFKPKQQRLSKGRLKGSVAPKHGMGELIDGLYRYLQSQQCPVYLNGEMMPDIGDAELRKHEPVIFCGSVQQASRFLADIDPPLAQRLGAIEMIGLSSITAFYPVTTDDPRGFGCLIPKSFQCKTLGVLFNTDIFPYRSSLRSENWIMTGVETWSGEAIKQQLALERKKLFGADSEAVEIQINQWPQALPHYTVELEQLLASGSLAALEQQGILLHGNYLGNIGLAGLLDQSQKLADRLATISG